MKDRICPNSLCLSNKSSNVKPQHGVQSSNFEPQIIKDGSFYRKSDGQKIQRLKCKLCKHRFSNATFSLAYRQNKRKVNHRVEKLLCSKVSMRRIAKILNIHRTTVARKLVFLAKKSRLEKEKFLSKLKDYPCELVHFDDLITIEHTKLKPLTVACMVDAKRRYIIGVSSGKMPSFGHLSKFSKAKYGKRSDQRKLALENLFKQTKEVVKDNVRVHSDDHKLYPDFVKKYFPKDTDYRQYKSKKGCSYGQGELKRVSYDPLFYINHTFARMRDDINRLVRKSWCTTKDPARLQTHFFGPAVRL